MVSRDPIPDAFDDDLDGSDDWLEATSAHPAILALRAETPGELRHAVKRLFETADRDEEVERGLVESLASALESGESEDEVCVWITTVLGELRSAEAISTLLRAFAAEDSEELQDAAGIALIRIGAEGLEALMAWVDDEPGRDLRSRAYQLLGNAGLVEDASFLDRAREYLRERLDAERWRAGGDRALEDVVDASIRLGDREQIEPLQALIEESPTLRAGLEDAIAELRANVEGAVFVADPPPWEERYGWLLEGEDDRGPEGESRESWREDPDLGLRPDESDPVARRLGDAGSIPDETALSCLYWGAGSTGAVGEEILDAREHLERAPEDESAGPSHDDR